YTKLLTHSNTAFELELFSFLHKLGLGVTLKDPNPDLMISTNKLDYNVECKRPASRHSIEKNIRKGLKQLRKPSISANVPTLALSLDKVFQDGDLIFHSNDENAALAGLDKLLFDFANENKSMLSKLCGASPCVVLYYLSCLSGFADNSPMASTTYMVGNIFNFDTDMSHKIHEDLVVFSGRNLTI
ncbi:MAG TPA: hypothetical protein DEP87_03070, partial [Candidatus Pacebacteria bacterium]|nr:hypothetical protein [Candidatus Paceibacterota bacterium]